ncbi:uncharacterized protein LOC128387054 [Panonychus citri]|uniref:uncharacterized protein LOC128387054 n=1 Tax=Panonychus citri TaxID=50023 RepID=UPI0023082E17|nr:uncharacterized protein LOC128387054 [Panonychus citri]
MLTSSKFILIIILVATFSVDQSNCQGAYDPYTSFRGERKGSFTPGQVTGIIFGSIACAIALAVTLGFCYFVYRSENEKSNGGRYTPTAYQET